MGRNRASIDLRYRHRALPVIEHSLPGARPTNARQQRRRIGSRRTNYAYNPQSVSGNIATLFASSNNAIFHFRLNRYTDRISRCTIGRGSNLGHSILSAGAQRLPTVSSVPSPCARLALGQRHGVRLSVDRIIPIYLTAIDGGNSADMQTLSGTRIGYRNRQSRHKLDYSRI